MSDKKNKKKKHTWSSSWTNSDGISLRMIFEKMLSPSAMLRRVEIESKLPAL